MRLIAAALLSAISQDGIDGLIDRLGSDRIEEREAAARALGELGPAVLPHLSLRESDPDPEVRARARHLRLVIGIRGTLGAGLLERFPGIDERLARGEWREAQDAARSAGLDPAEIRSLIDLASGAARRTGQEEEFLRRFPKPLVSGTTIAEEPVRAPVDASVRCFGHTIGIPTEVRWTRSIRVAVIGDRACREGDLLPEFNARVHRIWAHGVELRPLDRPPKPPEPLTPAD
jgi:hypothetical protein